MKRDYSYAFTAEMARDLENYEFLVKHARGALKNREFNVAMIDMVNSNLVRFIKTCDVHEGVVIAFTWDENRLAVIEQCLEKSDLAEATISPPSKVSIYL